MVSLMETGDILDKALLLVDIQNDFYPLDYYYFDYD